jgi:hypothetical protein
LILQNRELTLRALFVLCPSTWFCVKINGQAENLLKGHLPMFTLRSLAAFAASSLILLPSVAFAQPDAAPVAAAPTNPKTKKARKPRDPNAKPRTPGVRGTAYVRVLHAIEGGPQVDVVVDGGKKAEGVEYKTLSDYLALPSGSRLFSIKKAGGDETLASIRKSVKADTYYVLAAATVEGKPGFVWHNEVTGKPNPARAALRVYHLAAGAPAVSVTSPSARGKNKMRTMIKELTFGQSRASTLPAGTATVQIRSGDKVLKEAPATVEAGKRYAAFAIGNKDNIDLIIAPVGK